MRKRSNHNKITFFSFQDIVTGITGIMILMMLVICIQIMNSESTTPDIQKQAVEERNLDNEHVNKEDMYVRLRVLEKEYINNKTILITLAEKTFDNISNNLKTKEQLKVMIREEISDLKTMNKALEKRKIQNQSELYIIEEKKDIFDERESLTSQLDGLTIKKEQLTRQLSSIDFINEIYINSNHESTKDPIIVELSGKYIRARLLDDKENRNSIYSNEAQIDSLEIKRFIKWLSQFDEEKNYVVVLVKPSAVSVFGDLSDKIKKNSFEIGWEPIEEEKVCVYEK